MTAPPLALPSTEEAGPKKLLVYHYVGIGWLVYWMTNSYRWISDLAPFIDFYVVTGILLIYFSVVRPVLVVNMIGRPALWLISLTALIPILLYITDSDRNAFTYLEMRTRIVTFSLIAGSALVMAGTDGPWILRRAALISMLVAVIVNFGEYFVHNPYNRVVEGTRSAGFYGDPNIAGAAIGTLLLLAIPIRRQTMTNLILAAIAYMGILATLSRSGMLFASLLLAAYIFLPRGPGTLPTSTRAAVGLGGLAALIGLATVAIFVFNLRNLEIWRLTSAFTLDVTDNSAQSRMDFASFAFERFLDYFWTGRGPGSAREYHVSAHNTYLTLGYDYGILGILFYVGFVTWGLVKVVRYGWVRATTYFFLSFQVAYYSMFAHTVHDNPIFAVMFASFLTNASLDSPPKRMKFFANQPPEDPLESISSQPAIQS